MGIRCADHVTSAKVGTSFTDRRRLLCRPKPCRAVAPLDYSVFRYVMLMCTHICSGRSSSSQTGKIVVTLAQGPMGVRYPLVCAKVVSVSTGEVPVYVSSEFFVPTLI